MAAAEDAFFRAIGEPQTSKKARSLQIEEEEQFPAQPAALSPTVLEAEYEVVQDCGFEDQVANPNGKVSEMMPETFECDGRRLVSGPSCSVEDCHLHQLRHTSVVKLEMKAWVQILAPRQAA